MIYIHLIVQHVAKYEDNFKNNISKEYILTKAFTCWRTPVFAVDIVTFSTGKSLGF